MGLLSKQTKPVQGETNWNVPMNMYNLQYMRLWGMEAVQPASPLPSLGRTGNLKGWNQGQAAPCAWFM